MKETGTIVEIEEGQAKVLFKRTSMCAKCGACGMGSTQDDIVVPVANDLNARKGDEVEVEFTSRNALASSAIGYIFPLIMLFLGIFVGYSIPPIGSLIPDVMAAIFGLAFALGSYLILRALDPVLRRKFSNVYTMRRVVTQVDDQ